jgi:hypothetical protein
MPAGIFFIAASNRPSAPYFSDCSIPESTWYLAWTYFQDVQRNIKLTALILPIYTITTLATDANSS